MHTARSVGRLSAAPAAMLFLLLAAQLTAGPLVATLEKDFQYWQSGPASPSAPTAFRGGFSLQQTPGSYDSASVAYPGPASPWNLAVQAPCCLGYEFGFGSQADMDAALPFGTYTFTAANSATLATDSAVVDYSADAYPSVIPAFSAATWNALQGMDSSRPFTLEFNAFPSTPVTTIAWTDIIVWGGFSSFLQNSSTSAVIPAGALLPGTAYSYSIVFGNDTQGVRFSFTTNGSFTTGAVPEPLPSVLVLIGCGALGVRARRLRNR
jgi:hypothetical protein